jgi:hypothetical protein
VLFPLLLSPSSFSLLLPSFQRSGQDARCDKAVDYSLVVDVAMDGLHTRLDRDTFVVGERGHRGSIGINDASCYIMTEKMACHGQCSLRCPRGAGIAIATGTTK